MCGSWPDMRGLMKSSKLKSFIVFDIMSASIRETGGRNDCETIGGPGERERCVRVRKTVCVCFCMHVCTPQGAAEAQSVFCNYKIISRCPEEI